MKVISRGILPEDEEYTASCSHCKSVLQFLKKEVRCENTQREGISAIFKCPVCSKETYSYPTKVVKYSPVPMFVKDPKYVD